MKQHAFDDGLALNQIDPGRCSGQASLSCWSMVGTLPGTAHQIVYFKE